MFVKITLPEDMSWIGFLSRKAKGLLFRKLLEEKFGGLSEVEALDKAMRMIREEGGESKDQGTRSGFELSGWE